MMKKQAKQKNTKSDKLYYLLMAILMVIFLGSGGLLLKDYLQKQRQDAALSQIASLFPQQDQVPLTRPDDQNVDGQTKQAKPADDAEAQTAKMEIAPRDWKAWWEQVAAGRFATYRSLQRQNEDFVGWVRIEGTRIDYPVVQTPEQPDYYLHRDFDRQYSSYGIPYMAEGCRYEEPGTNLMIYGHHMKNGSMFAALQNYTEEAYYRQHPYIQFDTVDRAGSYEIVAVVKLEAADDTLPWQKLLFPESREVFDEAWQWFKRQSFYPTEVTPSFDDRLLALVTCEYTLEDGRLMVVAREIR